MSQAIALPESTIGNWYDIETALGIIGLSRRTLFRRIAEVPANCKREEPQAVGRPKLLLHCQALPQLAAHHALHGDSIDPPALRSLGEGGSDSELALANSVLGNPHSAILPGPSARDLAIGELRLQVIKHYESMLSFCSAERARKVVADEWSRKIPTRDVKSRERLDGGHIRHEKEVVSLGAFSPETLRSWLSLYRKAANDQAALLALCPQHSQKGRKALDIPESLVEFVALLSVSTVRADVAKAVAKAKEHMPAEFRQVSIDTWRRRLLARDPRGQGKALMHGVASFRKTLPDISMDWDSLPYNGLWEIDDVEKDWYAYGSELQTLLRPHGYAIIRVRTRQWVAFAASETDITHEQVRRLCGFAFANPAGGIPDKMKFEHRTAAAKKEFANLLRSLGIEVGEISMDSGASVTGLVSDVASGHAQGHGVIEANNRRAHNIEWDQALQVGSDERVTAPKRLEKIKALARDAAKRGDVIAVPTPQQWYLTFYETMEKHNNTPHSGLPKIIDPATGKSRHMTPNECSISLRDTAVRVMDERLIPLFHCQADEVPVTKNGFQLNNVSYGRFVEELQKFQTVHAFASVDYPSIAYVQELGRCVKAYEKAGFDEEGQLAAQKHAEKTFRNAHESMVARVVAGAKPGVFDMLLASANPTPNRKTELACPPDLLKDASALAAGIAAERDRRQELAGRFSDSPALRSLGEGGSASPSKGLLAREQELEEQGL